MQQQGEGAIAPDHLEVRAWDRHYELDFPRTFVGVRPACASILPGLYRSGLVFIRLVHILLAHLCA